MINRKFSEPLGRATKFSHPRATMSVIVVMFIAANKFTAFCAIRLLDFRPKDHRRQQNRRRAGRSRDHEVRPAVLRRRTESRRMHRWLMKRRCRSNQRSESIISWSAASEFQL